METVVPHADSKSRLLVKVCIIGCLVLGLQIPAYYVERLVEEREGRQTEAITEVSSKWAGKQEIEGPSVILPYWSINESDSTKKFKIKRFATFLPDQLNVNATVEPIERYRGIYKVMLYNSLVHINGTFTGVDVSRLHVPAENILWNEAFVRMNVSDPKGLNKELALNWNDTTQSLSTLSPDPVYDKDGLFAPLQVTNAGDLKNVKFTSDFGLKGSSELLFSPIGRQTTVNLQSKWPHPSFVGDILPTNTMVKDSGFTATWTSMAHNRPLEGVVQPGVVTAADYQREAQAPPEIKSASFGTSLFIPVSSYQKTLRSVKYSFLCILLTFAAFFLVETNNKKQIHPFQYGLIGLALIIFYTLLLSFSEYVGFNPAYGIATLFTIGLVGWFVKGVMGSAKSATLLSLVLALIYSYVFTILQLQDYALLLGSIGLFITLAIIMHFSKKIQW